MLKTGTGIWASCKLQMWSARVLFAFSYTGHEERAILDSLRTSLMKLLFEGGGEREEEPEIEERRCCSLAEKALNLLCLDRI